MSFKTSSNRKFNRSAANISHNTVARDKHIITLLFLANPNTTISKQVRNFTKLRGAQRLPVSVSPHTDVKGRMDLNLARDNKHSSNSKVAVQWVGEVARPFTEPAHVAILENKLINILSSLRSWRVQLINILSSLRHKVSGRYRICSCSSVEHIYFEDCIE